MTRHFPPVPFNPNLTWGEYMRLGLYERQDYIEKLLDYWNEKNRHQADADYEYDTARARADREDWSHD